MSGVWGAANVALSVSVNIAGLAAGSYSAEVTVDPDDPECASSVIDVSLELLPPAGLVVNVVDATTTEAGGTGSFNVALASEPLANVEVAVATTDATEGTMDKALLTFTPANWATPQTVVATGVDDALDDGDVAYSASLSVSSADAAYDALADSAVALTNEDDDTAGVIVTPTSGLITTEAGATDSFTVRLASRPEANVTVTLNSSDPGEGTVSPSPLTFTTSDWADNRTVTVTGVDDALIDGDQAYTITLVVASSDPDYNGIGAPSVSATNRDNDGVIVVTPTSGLQTTESGGSDTFTVVLGSAPTSQVTIGLSSSDPTEGTLSTGLLTFTTANWNVAQTVTVTGVDDAVVDGPVTYTIVTAAAASADPAYNGRNAADVSATNADNDGAAIVVAPTSTLRTSEDGDTDSFTVVLTMQPTGNVTVPISSSDVTEAAVSTGLLTFTPANWNVPQTVVVQGLDDALADGDQSYSVVIGVASSTDARYQGLNPADLAGVNEDDETQGQPQPDDRDEQAQEKVTICHVPPGNPDNAHTIRVGAPAVDAHLAHGDTLGACPD